MGGEVDEGLSMYYNNYPYGIFNTNDLNTTILNSTLNKHTEQQKNICDMVKAISDYCEAARKVEPTYQQEAIDACLAELVRQMNKQSS